MLVYCCCLFVFDVDDSLMLWSDFRLFGCCVVPISVVVSTFDKFYS